VTGGSRGIGAAIARELAANGADVAQTYQHAEQQAKGVVADIEALGRRAIAVQADSADAAAVVAAGHRTAAELGGLDILVNNAGIFPSKPYQEFTLEEIDRALN
ncbi:SDR family NAD(P)-dependent oxidoreductase, partial [Nocardia cyriacigeorgica]|uniref:SDR family NAD(P)-dependent oxidoreductase n=1 Tax=Nocardia cyriacigeorgica TaxID=135487 RepID=UPI0034DAE574